MPLREGYVQLSGTLSSLSGASARLEAGLHPWERVGIFAFGEVNQRERMAGGGLRWEFGL